MKKKVVQKKNKSEEDMAFDKYSGEISHLKLIRVANKLDIDGKHKEADEFDKIIKKYFLR